MTARRWGELELIARIRRQAGSAEPGLVRGIGDDCAVYRLSAGSLGLVTTDTLVAGIHFDPAWHPPRLLGRKSASVNLSDIAAMGGTPRFATLSLALAPGLDDLWLEEFVDGFLEVLREHQTLLAGGDTVASGRDLMFSISILGEAEADRVLYRSGARPGDLVWVSGVLGRAAAGLALCRDAAARRNPRWQPLLKAHLDPVPQVRLGRMLAASGMVHAMQDISDGIATDLAHLCAESGVGAEIEAAGLPRSAELEEAARLHGHSWLDWALRGGEDYQLLFTTPGAAEKTLPGLVKAETGCNISLVGRIVAGGGVTLLQDGKRRDIAFQGYEHLRKP